jgi:tetratricopeptide (TPR) repeat protein
MGADAMTEQTTSELTTCIALLARANELRCRKDYEAAIALYIRSIKHFGESADLLAVVAGCYFALAGSTADETGRNFKEAILWMKKAVELAPNDARLHADLAQYYALGVPDYEKAVREYRKAIELDPHITQALVGAASLYGVPEEVVTLDEAIGWLERVVQLDPDDPNHHFGLGELYREAGRSSDAEKEWLRAFLRPQPLASRPAQVIESVLAVRRNT